METVSDHPRLLLPGFLPLDLCKELEFIHRSCGTVGYRPSVFSTTLSHLIATNCAHLIIPFIPIRERLKEKVEEFFNCEYELVIEFTGLVSWCRGASIGWHSDDNMPYLKQRHFTAVCYLNNHGIDFKGGILHFKDGKQPESIIPTTGDVVIYTADNRNIHSVDEVTGGERLTLTLWFSHDSSYDEDSKLIARLDEILIEHQGQECHIPSLASCNMYQYSQLESGFDIRSTRLNVLGYSLCSFDRKVCHSSSDSSDNPMEKPIQICRGDQVYNKEFANSMHALQVVQFYYWKASELKAARKKIDMADLIDSSLIEKNTDKKLLVQYNVQFVEPIFDPKFLDDVYASFDWGEFSIAVREWNDHVQKLHEILMTSLSSWKTHQTLFSSPELGEKYGNRLEVMS